MHREDTIGTQKNCSGGMAQKSSADPSLTKELVP
jgi:hypothetical protein